MTRSFALLVFALGLAGAAGAQTLAQSGGESATSNIAIVGPKPPSPQVGPQACTPIATVGDLNQIRSNLEGKYCLVNDIDASSSSSFASIGSRENKFHGTLDGRGHVVRGLTITGDGLFAWIGRGTVRNFGLVDVRLTSTAGADVARVFPTSSVGALAGFVGAAGIVERSFATGVVSSDDHTNGGGLVGFNIGKIIESWANVAVSVSTAGGLVGVNVGLIHSSYAIGLVKGSFAAGGLAAINAHDAKFDRFGKIVQSYAAAPVTAGPDQGNSAGGLVSRNAARVADSFALGPATAPNVDGWAGGIAARNQYRPSNSIGDIWRSYAAGPIAAANSIGVVALGHSSQVKASYWDTETTDQATSHGGTGLATAQLQSAIPAGFNPERWAITPGVSYPYLKLPARIYMAPLATTVVGTKLYIYLPIGQLEPSEYSQPVAHADEASKAAAYTMIARAIGIAENVAALKNVKIDTYFWDDATQKTTWQGPITDYASIGDLIALSENEPIRHGNILGPLRNDQVVIIRGRYKKPGGGNTDHWMLATSFITDAGGNVEKLVANDPWLGRQVRIDPQTKMVTAPPNYPLENFTVTGYRVVTFTEAASSAAFKRPRR